SYLKQQKDCSKDCSYHEFLNTYRDIIVTSSSFSDDWRGLDGTWYKRFLKELEKLYKDNFSNIKEKVNDDERKEFDFQCYWEEILEEKKKNALKRKVKNRIIDIYDVTSENVGDEIFNEIGQLKRIRTESRYTSKVPNANILSNGKIIEKPNILEFFPSSAEESEDEEKAEDILESNVFLNISSSSEKWYLPSNQTVDEIFSTNVSSHIEVTKNKKKLTPVDKAILRYGASKLIDLSSKMNGWFTLDQMNFMINDHKKLIILPDLPEEINIFICNIEKIWGEWEFAVKTTPGKVIKDRCYSSRINQSIMNGLLHLNLANEQVNQIKVPFIQVAGTNGQMLLEVLLHGFYLVIPGPKFQIPTKLDQIAKLRQTVRVIQHVMNMYGETNELVNSLEVGYHEFDDVFNNPVTNIHSKSHYISKPWWS
ncbi:2591_t:CDS:2, partial [Entrophospora sp. SA101]